MQRMHCARGLTCVATRRAHHAEAAAATRTRALRASGPALPPPQRVSRLRPPLRHIGRCGVTMARRGNMQAALWLAALVAACLAAPAWAESPDFVEVAAETHEKAAVSGCARAGGC